MKFYDTSALLDLPPDTLLAEPFLIADITLYELEDIKTSGKKDEATKAKARTVTRLLAEHPAAYTVVSIDYHQLFSILNDVPVKDNNDGTIMAAARWYLNELIEKKEDAEKIQTRTGVFEKSAADELVAKTTADVDSFCFVTSDLSCFNLAQRVMKLPCELSLDSCGAHNDYTGWTEVALEDSGEEALAMAYSKDVEQKNLFDTPTNGYVLIPNADADGNTAGLRWDGSRYVPIKYKNLNTAYSGKIKPLNNQQKLAFDLLQNDDITIKLLLGVYGSGKDFLMVNHAVDLIEKGKYDKIVWVRNNIEVKDTKEIGFLPGSMLEKVYPFAAILADCLGGEVALERAITDGWVEIQPLGFIRGRSFNRSIIYCSEAENLTKQHIQLLIGRVGEGSTLWINGDLRQIDDVAFERNNGIQKLIDNLTGNERFGTVYLPITERSETARLADLLD
jgi:predicted ribonuclease YlaK|nr:MAG TPA: PhoH-like protein [Caudoviricetes sp.]